MDSLCVACFQVALESKQEKEAEFEVINQAACVQVALSFATFNARDDKDDKEREAAKREREN